MTKEETAHLLLASAHATEAAAHLILVPDHNPANIDHLTAVGQECLSFARDLGEK